MKDDSQSVDPNHGRDSGGVKQIEAGLLRYRVAFALIATLLFIILVMLPFSFTSVLEDLVAPPGGQVYPIEAVPRSAGAPTYASLHVTIVAIDEVQQLATLRFSGHHVCRTVCPWSNRVVFFSLAEDESATEGLPPSADVTLPPTSIEVTETHQLPIRGHPIRYPFDTYDLWLGVALQRVFPDGSLQTLTPSEAAGQVFLTVQELLPRQTMRQPVPIGLQGVTDDDDPYGYLHVLALNFSRPLYLRVLSVLLVLLVAAAASYAIFLRPLNELVVNSGALVLGVWGVRSILMPQNVYFLTAVDVSLSMVILLLLGAITVRALLLVHERGDLRLLSRRTPK